MNLKTRSVVLYLLAYVVITLLLYLFGFKGLDSSRQLLTFQLIVPLFNAMWVFAVILGVRYRIKVYVSRGKVLNRIFYSRKRLKLEPKYISKSDFNTVIKRFNMSANEMGFEFNNKGDNEYELDKKSNKSIIDTKIDLDIYHDIVQTVVKTNIRNEGNTFVSKVKIALCILTLLVSLTSIFGFIGTFLLAIYAMGQEFFMQEIIERDVNKAHQYILDVTASETF